MGYFPVHKLVKPPQCALSAVRKDFHGCWLELAQSSAWTVPDAPCGTSCLPWMLWCSHEVDMQNLLLSIIFLELLDHGRAWGNSDRCHVAVNHRNPHMGFEPMPGYFQSGVKCYMSVLALRMCWIQEFLSEYQEWKGKAVLILDKPDPSGLLQVEEGSPWRSELVASQQLGGSCQPFTVVQPMSSDPGKLRAEFVYVCLQTIQ